MSLTRRGLLHATVAGAALVSAPVVQPSAAEDHDRLTLWLNEDCCLARESAAGYRRALQGVANSRTIIVPAISALTWRTADTLRAKAEVGKRIVLESAFTFADVDVAERQCRIVRDMFGLPLLLDRERREKGTSYLQYRWPVEALVRCFGEPRYIGPGDHHAIAHHPGQGIVAARKSIGRGQIIFLGSPLGPLLFAEDREARVLIRRIITESA